MKIEDIKKFAEGKDIDLTACTTDAQVIEAVDKYITKVETERDIATEQVTKFTEEKTSMEERIAKLEEGNLSAVIKMGIIAKKVLPTEEAQLITFGKSQGFIELQKLINDRPVLGVFAADTVDKKEPGGKIDLAAKKFQNEDGTPLTWKQFSEKVHKNPAFADQFTVEEQEAIKAGTAVTV